MKYPVLHKTYSADDNITVNDDNALATVLDYWKWAHSDLMDNAERGAFSEYIVAKAIGDNSKHRTNWYCYDLLSSEGIRVEVKTSAYIQSWGQNKLSEIKFGIGKTFGYNYETNSYDSKKIRHADVYVFCVLKETDQEKLNPLNILQWDFYVLPTIAIDNDPYYSEKQTISLKPLIKLGAAKCNFEQIHDEVINAAQKIKQVN